MVQTLCQDPHLVFKLEQETLTDYREYIKLKSVHVSVTTGAEGNDTCSNRGFDMNKTENNKQITILVFSCILR
ncbi:unnamed protein product [Macrosiphum euphorbiae]|nr:unnamed protein product [Macrosiphum euphorbiae]